jgi:transposase-like protein
METIAVSSQTMTCPICGNASKRFGKHRNGLQRFRCLSCRKTFTEDHKRSFRVEDYLNDPRGLMVIRMLVEGCSIRTIERITEIRRDTIVQLLLIAGERCARRMNAIRNVPAKDVQCDEMATWPSMNDSSGLTNTRMIPSVTPGHGSPSNAIQSLSLRSLLASGPATMLLN